MKSLQQEIDLADFDSLLELIRNELDLLVNGRYDPETNISLTNKKMDVLDAVEKLKRRIEMY